MRVKATDCWRLLQGAAVGLVIAAAMVTVPAPDYCRFCANGELPWYVCVFCACCNW